MGHQLNAKSCVWDALEWMLSACMQRGAQWTCIELTFYSHAYNVIWTSPRGHRSTTHNNYQRSARTWRCSMPEVSCICHVYDAPTFFVVCERHANRPTTHSSTSNCYRLNERIVDWPVYLYLYRGCHVFCSPGKTSDVDGTFGCVGSAQLNVEACSVHRLPLL